MQKPPYRSLFLMLFVLLSYAGYIWLRVQHILRIKAPREFYDTTEFFEIASLPLTSIGFWSAIKPPTFPLLLKLCGMNAECVVSAQLLISILAWGTLALVVAVLLQSFWLKPVGFILILAFSLVQNVILWDALIISESSAISLVVLWLATSLWLLEKWQPYRLVLLLLSSVLVVFVRDTLAYFLLLAGVGLLILLIFTQQRKRAFAVSSFFLALFLLVNMLSTAGMRWYTPFLMTMGLRILPNPEYVTYFEARGMPVSDVLMERAGKPIQDDNFAILYSPGLVVFRQWVRDYGRSEFIRFLWFFKADTLQNPLRDADLVFNPDVYYYAATGFRPILRDVRLNELLYPTRFGLLASFLANFLAIALLYPAFHFRNTLLMIPLMLILFSYPQAVLIWNADGYEIARHSISHVIMLRLGFWVLLLFVADFGITQLKSYRNRKTPNA
jgi:hypothetical protein